MPCRNSGRSNVRPCASPLNHAHVCADLGDPNVTPAEVESAENRLLVVQSIRLCCPAAHSHELIKCLDAADAYGDVGDLAILNQLQIITGRLDTVIEQNQRMDAKHDNANLRNNNHRAISNAQHPVDVLYKTVRSERPDILILSHCS